MDFFKQLHEASAGLAVTLRIMSKNDTLTIQVMPDDLKDIKPLLITGTPEELDAEFINTIRQPFAAMGGGLKSNVAEFSAAVEKLAPKPTPKAEPEPAQEKPEAVAEEAPGPEAPTESTPVEEVPVPEKKKRAPRTPAKKEATEEQPTEEATQAQEEPEVPDNAPQEEPQPVADNMESVEQILPAALPAEDDLNLPDAETDSSEAPAGDFEFTL